MRNLYLDEQWRLWRAGILKALLCVLLVSLLGSCASLGRIANQSVAEDGSKTYSFVQLTTTDKRSRDFLLILSFSGGGTRAAALSYGVLQELRDTMVTTGGKKQRLLDEVDMISAVSGGSFTAAYYGVYGDGIFENFEKDFLRGNFEAPLIRAVLAPWHWFSDRGRTELAIEMYEDEVFHGATFADMRREGAPLVIINATDLSQGFRFSFIQEYFDLLCSDVSSFPVARAVAASSAVPVMFNPVVLENHAHCSAEDVGWLGHAGDIHADNEEMMAVINALKSYHDKQKRPYVHYVDGGISDNLGLRAIYEFIELSGGAAVLLERLHRPPSHAVAVISVDASTESNVDIDASPGQPSLRQTIDAVSDVQLHRYNAATNKLMHDLLADWRREFSTPSHPVEAHFIRVRLADVGTPQAQAYVNSIPTSLNLDDEKVDMLIETGRRLLRENPEYQRFLRDIR